MLVEDAGIKGIQGVPCTVINNTWVIQGAQIADTFFAVRNFTSPSYRGADYCCPYCSISFLAGDVMVLTDCTPLRLLMPFR